MRKVFPPDSSITPVIRREDLYKVCGHFLIPLLAGAAFPKPYLCCKVHEPVQIITVAVGPFCHESVRAEGTNGVHQSLRWLRSRQY